MQRTQIADVQSGNRVRISGFVENFRNKRTMAFIVIRDITGKIQVTLVKEEHPELAEIADGIALDSVVTVEGQAVANDYVKLGGIEILPESIKIESLADALPIKPDSPIDSRLDFRWIDLRTEKNTLIFKLQTEMTAAFRDFLLSRKRFPAIKCCPVHNLRCKSTTFSLHRFIIQKDFVYLPTEIQLIHCLTLYN
jgi:aspartyl-tRNA synthetase